MAVPFTFGNFVKYWFFLFLILFVAGLIFQGAIKRLEANTNK